MTTGPDAAPISAKLAALIVLQKELKAAIGRMLGGRGILSQLREISIMAQQGLTDLQALAASFQTFAAAVVAELTALQASAGDPDATVETLTQQINASVATIQAALPATPPATP